MILNPAAGHPLVSDANYNPRGQARRQFATGWRLQGLAKGLPVTAEAYLLKELYIEAIIRNP